MDFWRHLKTVQRHRHLVRQYCFRLGLYWQGLTHDLSKFSPVEFWAGVKYFQGDRSPNDAQRRDKGYSASWMLRKLGLSLYLACLGIVAGSDFFSTVFRPEGLLWLGIGLLLTMLPCIIIGVLALRC